MTLAVILAAGAVAALILGVVDVRRARHGKCPPEQPIGLVLLATALAWLSWAVWPL